MKDYRFTSTLIPSSREAFHSALCHREQPQAHHHIPCEGFDFEEPLKQSSKVTLRHDDEDYKEKYHPKAGYGRMPTVAMPNGIAVQLSSRQ